MYVVVGILLCMWIIACVLYTTRVYRSAQSVQHFDNTSLRGVSSWGVHEKMCPDDKLSPSWMEYFNVRVNDSKKNECWFRYCTYDKKPVDRSECGTRDVIFRGCYTKMSNTAALVKSSCEQPVGYEFISYSRLRDKIPEGRTFARPKIGLRDMAFKLPTQLNILSPYKDTPCKCIEDKENVAKNQKTIKTVSDYLMTCYIHAEYNMQNSRFGELNNIVLDVLEYCADERKMVECNYEGYPYRMTQFLVPLMFFVARTEVQLTDKVKQWFNVLVTDTVNQFKDRKNNLRMWSLLALIIHEKIIMEKNGVSSALIEQFIDESIDSDGNIISEMSRGDKADEYHEYFMAPLVYAAALCNIEHPKLQAAVKRTFQLNNNSIPKPSSWIPAYIRTFNENHIPKAVLVDLNDDAYGMNYSFAGRYYMC